jgi:hypothetical protein
LLHTSISKKTTDFHDYKCVFMQSRIVSFLFVFGVFRSLPIWRRSLQLSIPGRIPGTRSKTLPPRSVILIKMDLYCVGARCAVPLRDEAASGAMTASNAHVKM